MSLAAAARTIDYTHFVEVEGTYADITATPAAGDAFRCRARSLSFKSKVSRLDRDQDSDRSASVHSTVIGRRSAEWEVPAALAPSGISATPTPADMGEFFRAHFGTQRIGTAHSTAAAGSTTTLINATPGGVVAMGLAVGDFAVFETTLGNEARQVVSIATDAIGVLPALASAPVNGSDIFACVTYKLTKATLLSLILYGYLDGDFEHLCAGAAAAEMEIAYDLGSETPEPMVTFKGPAARVETLGTAIPTPTLQTGRGIGPAVAWAWINGSRTCMTKLKLTSHNGMELRNNDSCSLVPTAIQRTANEGRYKVDLELEAVNVGADIEAVYDGARALATYDTTIQIGTVIGNGVVFRLPAFVPDADESEIDGVAGIVAKGRCYANGTTDDTEITLAFF